MGLGCEMLGAVAVAGAVNNINYGSNRYVGGGYHYNRGRSMNRGMNYGRRYGRRY